MHWRRKWQPTPVGSCLENPRDGGAWWAVISGVAQSRTWLKRLSSSSLLRNLYVDQEATVRTKHGTTDLFQIGKGVYQGCILSSWLFNLYVQCIMRNVRLDDAQTEIKIPGRNINNLWYEDNVTLMAESEEALKSILMKVKEEWKRLLKTQHSKNEDHPVPSLYGK